MTLAGDASYDVRVWTISVYKGRRGTSYTVTWLVSGSKNQRTFATRKLAESFRAGLITAARSGVQFFVSDGLPASMRTHQMERTWYAHACAFIDMKWANASPTHRRGLAEALVWVTTAMVTSSRDDPDFNALRKALFHWSFNVTARDHHPIEEAEVPADYAQEVAWIARRSLPLRSFASPATVRRAMDAISVKLDGTAAAAPTAARRRAALFSALQYAVELELLPNNPLKQLKLRRPIVAEAIDRRVVVNHAQASRLLSAVRSTYPSLEAYFACLYYAALRPAEARHLRVKDCALPESGWGELVLLGSTPDAGSDWTDSGQANEDRQLKHRGVSDTRPVPAPPELVEILRRHIATFPASPDGRLFVTRTGRAGVPLPPPFSKPLSMGTAYRVWAAARAAAFTDAQVASPLARRPYDLRHAAVSTWLNAGVPPTQVAEWAGHSVNVLLRVYAKCVYGQDEVARQRIEAALALTASVEDPDVVSEPDVAETSGRIPGEQP
ncbi:MAG TPA: tyrosine-type recombinase/integrase [Dermatophilaceae bacterium]